MIPFNFLEKKAAYLNTGVWAKKAMKEAKGFGEVVEVASSAEATYTYIPKDYTVYRPMRTISISPPTILSMARN